MLQLISTYISQHLNYILGALGVLGFSAINCMPINPPSSFAELWDWVRESLQTAIPINRLQRVQQPTSIDIKK